MPKWIYVAALMAATAGCSARCLVDSQPQGANVSVDDHPCGVTPVTVDLDTFWDDDRHVRVSLPGYYTDERSVAKTKESIWIGRRYPSSVFFRLVPQEAAQAACGACGKPMALDAAFCGSCGVRRP